MKSETATNGSSSQPRLFLRFAFLTTAIGIVVTLAAFFFVRNLEHQKITAQFEQEVGGIASSLRRHVDRHFLELESLVAFYAASDRVDRDEFANYVRPFWTGDPATLALGWIPRVRVSERTAYEQGARRDGLVDYELRDRVGDQLVRASHRPEYFPVYYVEPLQSNTMALGFDLASDPVRRQLLDTARDSGRAVTSGQLRLVRGDLQQRGILMLRPVYVNRAALDSVELRRRNLFGYVVVVVDVAKVAEAALEGRELRDLDLGLLDESAPAGERLLYFRSALAGAAPAGFNAEQMIANIRVGQHFAVTREFGGRRWTLVAKPHEGFFTAKQTWQPWAALGGGLLATALLGFYLNERRRSDQAIRQLNAELEQRVVDRTEQLGATNRQLGERSAFLNALVENSPLAIVALDARHHITMCNPAFERLFGYPPAEVLGQNIDEIVAGGGEYSTEATELTQRGLAGEAIHIATRRRRRDGSPVDVEIYGLPLKLDGQMVGAFALYQDITERRRAEQTIEQANQQLAARVRELQVRGRQEKLLHELAELLQSCHTADEAYQIITQHLAKLFPTEAGLLAIISSSRNVVEAVSVWGSGTRSERVFSPAECWSLRRGHLHRMVNPDTDPVCPHIHQAEGRSFLCVPMMAQGEALGVLHLEADRSGQAASVEAFTEDQQHLALRVAEQLALALANMRLRDSLRTQSIRDPLTGLFNRRYLEESLEREVRRATRRQRSLGAIMFDIDHFKRFNDTFGHAAGDTLLAELGRFLQMRTRGEDIACRYGGEEFTLILPEASLEDTRHRAEQLRDEVAHLHVEHRGVSLGAVTLSLGVAIFPEHGNSGEGLLRAADNALYRAKGAGRNCVVVAGGLDREAERSEPPVATVPKG